MNELALSVVMERDEVEKLCYCKIQKYANSVKIRDLFDLIRDEVAHEGETLNYVLDDEECACDIYDRINNLSNVSKKKLMKFLSTLEKFDRMQENNVKFL